MDADRRFLALAGGVVFLSVSAMIGGLTGALPESAGNTVVLVAAAVVLRVAWLCVRKSASSALVAKVTRAASSVGFAISVVVMAAAIYRISRSAGVGRLFIDAAAQLWTVALLTVIVSPVRTLGWRVFVGALVTGFLGLTSLARLVGRPFVEEFGTSNLLTVGVWIPVSEELIKILPLTVLLLLVVREWRLRPSALEMALIGAWTGAGFAIYEDASLGRGGFSLFRNTGFSLLFPSEGRGTAFGWTVIQNGHLVHTALISLGLAFALLYRRQLSRPWIAVGLAFIAPLIEHASQNSIISGGINSLVARAALAVTLNGRLSAILLVVGLIYVGRKELRAVDGRYLFDRWMKLLPSERAHRAMQLANAQARLPKERMPAGAAP
jgi:hypothetical protein